MPDHNFYKMVSRRRAPESSSDIFPEDLADLYRGIEDFDLEPCSDLPEFDAQLWLAEKNRAARAGDRSIISGVLTGRKEEKKSELTDFKAGLSEGRLFVTIQGKSMALSVSDDISKIALARIKELLRKNKIQLSDLKEIFGSAEGRDKFCSSVEISSDGNSHEVAFRGAEIDRWLVGFEEEEQETKKSKKPSRPLKKEGKKKRKSPESPLGDNEIVIPKFGKITFVSDNLILSAEGKNMIMCCDDEISESVLDRIKSLLRSEKMVLDDLRQIFGREKGRVHVFTSITLLPSEGLFKIDFVEPAASDWLAKFGKRSKPSFSKDSIFIISGRLTVKLDDVGELVFEEDGQTWGISILGDEGEKIWKEVLTFVKSGVFKLSDFFARGSRVMSGCSKRPRYQDYEISLDPAEARKFLQKFED
ncbi:MAG: hypothetical protein ABIH35_01260 [Patescibacteria group bacterium]